jgi:hypothetical protein
MREARTSRARLLPEARHGNGTAKATRTETLNRRKMATEPEDATAGKKSLSDMYYEGVPMRSRVPEKMLYFEIPPGFVRVSLLAGGLKDVHHSAITSYGPEIENAETGEFIATALGIQDHVHRIEVVNSMSDIAASIRDAERVVRARNK